MRPDLSSDLVHWTREPDALNRLLRIIASDRLLGGSEMRKGNWLTVCFTEAPVDAFHVRQAANRYSRFGIIISKKWAYAQGARPVLYLRDSEYAQLPESLQWRYVRHEPDGETPIDFSWEREWRIPTAALSLAGSSFGVVVPDERSVEIILSQHVNNESWRIWGESQVYGDWYAYQQPEDFRHAFRVLPP